MHSLMFFGASSAMMPFFSMGSPDKIWCGSKKRVDIPMVVAILVRNTHDDQPLATEFGFWGAKNPNKIADFASDVIFWLWINTI